MGLMESARTTIELTEPVTLWRRWLAADNTSSARRVLAGALTVGGFTVLAKLAMAAQTLALAYRFGVGDATDAFVMATLGPLFAVAVLGGAFESSLIPTYIRVREQDGRAPAAAVFGAVLGWTILGLSILSLMMALALPWGVPALAPRFTTAKLGLTISLALWMTPVLLLRGSGKLWRAVLNADERFVAAAAIPALTPLVVVTAIAAAGHHGIQVAAMATLAGAVLEVCILVWLMRRHGIRVRPVLGRLSPEARQVLRQYAPMAAGAALMAGTMIADQVMAARMSAGSVSTLTFAGQVVAVICVIPSLALGTSAAPQFSRMIARGDWRALRSTWSTYTRWIWRGSVPLTLLLILCSPLLAKLLFERGAFTAADTAQVAQAQAYYLLQAPFYLAGTLGARLLSALLLNDNLFWIAGVSLALKVILNYVLADWMGVAGIALATSLMYLFSWTAIGGCLRRRLAREAA